MNNLGIIRSNDNYYLASRTLWNDETGITSTTTWINACTRYIATDGSLGIVLTNEFSDGTSGVYGCTNSNYYWSGSLTCGLRPVFSLNANIKITGENGSASSPWTLGL